MISFYNFVKKSSVNWTWRTPHAMRYLLLFFYFGISILFSLALIEYPGKGHVYLLFSLVANTLLYFGFRKNAIFFDTFIGVFFWLGFWLKLTIRVAFMGSQFYESTGNFNGSGAAFDQALLVTSCGFLGLLTASYLRERHYFTYPKNIKRIAHVGLQKFYQNNRKSVLSGFVLLFIAIAATNLYYGIYQRGAVPRTSLPYGLGGIYSWLLLFGLASVSALVMHYEYASKKKTTLLVAILGMMENFFTNVSLLSRGMILNAGALAYGVLKSKKLIGIETNYRFWMATTIIFFLLFGCSIALVNHFRTGDLIEHVNLQSLYKNVTDNSYMAKPLFLDRWVGIEGVMSVTSYPGLGWKLWGEAWRESYSHNKTSFYDMNIITSPYKNTDTTKYHSVSLPGILAFCFYPGSFVFLFVCMFLLGTLAATVEVAVFKLGGGNIILCALLAQVVAYRYAHFGYVPNQSYLLFGALFLNLLLIYFANKFLLYWNTRAAERAHSNP